MDKRVVVIVGPTAVGKSHAGLNIAVKLNGEIVSADSVQVYKHLDIGSAKPTLQEQQAVPHHMIDILEPTETYSVALYAQQARMVLDALLEKGITPVVVGGTGLYINALTYPMDFTPADVDEEYRNRLMQISQEEGNEKLQEMLRRVDVPSAQRIKQNDTKRLIRALEIHHMTGKPMSAYEQDYRNAPPEYDFCMIGLTMDREALYQKINARVDGMMKAGLLQETEALSKRYPDSPVLQNAIGYKQLLPHIEQHVPLDDAVELIKRETRRFAKRQLTWFRRDTRIHWVNAEMEEKGIEGEILDIIQNKL
ncbi:tRNA (adenosine(37)-N6)-dimethylallyltransferase MiaA [Clostridia bacterium OttesenSCG-928-F22]|nr:tRNA (adenosine(37)-N6)-dimethylallyltransferase MiaA [Clostridia bacterium OttesenSCG-928-F22]